MVRRQTVISEMTGHQNNLACAGVVGLQMFFFFYLLFSNIFQIKEYILLLRPKKGKVIYKRLWTLASRCLRGISVSRPSQLRQPHPLLHSSPQSSIPTPDLGLNTPPHLISEGLQSSMSMKLSPACSDFPHTTPLPSPLSARECHSLPPRTAITHWRCKLLSTGHNYSNNQMNEYRERDIEQRQCFHTSPIYLLTYHHNSLTKKAGDRG